MPCSWEEAVEQVCSASFGLPEALVARSIAMQRPALHVICPHSVYAVVCNCYRNSNRETTPNRGKTHTDKCMHHMKHPLRLKFDAAAASSSAVTAHVNVLPLYSATIVVIGPDASGGGGSEALSTQRGRFPTKQSFCALSSFTRHFARRCIAGIMQRSQRQLGLLQRWLCSRMALR